MKLWQWLKGKKTFIISFVVAVLLVLHTQFGLVPDQWFALAMSILVPGGVMALRAGMNQDQTQS